MNVLTLDHDQVSRLLTMGDCISAMEACLVDVAAGAIANPLRSMFRPPDAGGLMGLMPAYLGGDEPVFGVKAICVFPGNPTLGKDAHQGAVLLFSGETGELLAVMNASAITAIRTAAVSAVATKALARRDAATLAVIGAGVQARAHLEAMARVMTVEHARVAGRDRDRLHRMVDDARARFDFPVEATDAEHAVRSADVVVTVTSSPHPVVDRSWIAPGTHINAVGSSIPTSRELDTATVAAARLFVDRRESTVNESGDYLMALAEGGITGPEHIVAELGEVVAGRAEGRRSPEEITLFKSLGLAAEDLAAARHLLGVARQSDAGTWVEL